MPDHETHELMLYPALVATVWWVAGWSIAFLFTCGITIGTALLSPDLDIQGAAWRRWWALKFIWVPYQAIISHRSKLSHWPVLGTVGRLLYLSAPVCVVLLILDIHGIYELDHLRIWFEAHDHECYAGLAGIEASSVLHFIMDEVG